MPRWLYGLVLGGLLVSGGLVHADSEKASDGAKEVKVSFTFRNTPVRDALTDLARAGKLNLIVAPGVEGTVNAYFHRIPALQAVKVIAEQVGAEVVEKKGVYLVRPRRPAEEEAQEESPPPAQEEGEPSSPSEESSSPRIRIFHPQYQRPSFFARLLGGYVVDEMRPRLDYRPWAGTGLLLGPRLGSGGFYGYRFEEAPSLRLRFGPSQGQTTLSFGPNLLSGRIGGLQFEFRGGPLGSMSGSQQWRTNF